MININFKKLAITNFLSIGNDPVVVEFTPGSHIITGINLDKPDRRNGVGKSAVIKAFYYAIIGDTQDKLKKEFISNNITGKSGKVSLQFDVVCGDTIQKCQIDRTVKPASCSFIVNGVDKTRDSIANTTADICKILKLTPEILQNCIIMSLNDTESFMTQSKNEKREFIEHIFKLEVFNSMFDEAKTEYNALKKNLDVKNSDYSRNQQQIQQYNDKQQKALQELQEKIQKHVDDIEKIDQNIDELNKQINSLIIPDVVDNSAKLNELETKKQQVDVKLHEYDKQLGEISATIRHLKQQLNTYNNVKAVCPTCKRPFDEINVDEINTLKQETQKNIDEYVNKQTTIDNSHNKAQNVKILIETNIKKLQDEERQADKLKYQKRDWLSKVEQLQSTKQIKQDTITTLKQSTLQTYDDIIQTLKCESEKMLSDIEKLKKDVYIAEINKFITSEEGVKSYLIKKIIEVFNEKLDYYIKKLDGNSVCKFDEYFDETITTTNGKQCSYKNFSGAERKAIDLACLFTFMDMRSAQGNVTYNVSFYDELLDSSLDEKGISKVVDILNERVAKFNECVYVVTHRGEIMNFAKDTITLIKEKGVTKLK